MLNSSDTLPHACTVQIGPGPAVVIRPTPWPDHCPTAQNLMNIRGESGITLIVSGHVACFSRFHEMIHESKDNKLRKHLHAAMALVFSSSCARDVIRVLPYEQR